MSPTHHSPLTTLVLGDVRTAEMRAVMDAVLSIFGDGEVRLVRSTAVVVQEEADDARFGRSLVVVCQRHPDEYTPADVHALIRRFPLARWVCCFGLWCESDGRNRDVWPVSVRVPARMVRDRLTVERDVLRGRMDDLPCIGFPAALPLTGGREEAFEFDARREGAPVDEPRARGTAPAVAVVSPDRELRLRLADDLRLAGFRLARDDEPCAAVLFDADPWDEGTATTLRRLRRRHRSAAIVALMNFARPEDERCVRRDGADGVVAKLSTAAELLEAIHRGRLQRRTRRVCRTP